MFSLHSFQYALFTQPLKSNFWRQFFFSFAAKIWFKYIVKGLIVTSSKSKSDIIRTEEEKKK